MKCRQSLLVSWNPGRLVGFVLDENDTCIGVTTGTTEDYIGRDREYIMLAMGSIMRYRLGTEVHETSADGYPANFLLRPEDGYRDRE